MDFIKKTCIPEVKIDDEFIAKLTQIKEKGLPIKYSTLCDIIGMKRKSSYSKEAQLKELRCYCDLNIITTSKSRTALYMIDEVYPQAVKFMKIIGESKTLRYFEATLYQAIVQNKKNPLYLSNMEMLRLFKEVNDNFELLGKKKKNNEENKIEPYLIEMGEVVYRILHRWTSRKIKAMEGRMVIIPRKGFRLYTQANNVYTKVDIPPESELEHFCRSLYDEVADKILGKEWRGEWVPEWLWRSFEKELAAEVMLKTKGRYCNLKVITIMSFPSDKWIQQKLDQIYGAIPVLNEINEEACRKVLNTKQLNDFTEDQRRGFVDWGIKI